MIFIPTIKKMLENDWHWLQKKLFMEKILFIQVLFINHAKKKAIKSSSHLKNTGSGLITNDGEELSEFAIAGADKKFIWAKAKIEGDKVVVWNEAVARSNVCAICMGRQSR